MPQFTVDDDIAALVERLAKKRPFENLSFNDALRRILLNRSDQAPDNLLLKELDGLLTKSVAGSPKKAPSPSATAWVSSVTELRDKQGLNNWTAICRLLEIDTAGDSARRRLKNWVKINRPNWPDVPDA